LPGGREQAVRDRKAFVAAILGTLGIVFAMSGGAFAGAGPAHLLKDINQVPSSNRGSFPQGFRRLGNILLFQAFTPETGRELWRTDGTEAGTFLVKDIHPGYLPAFNYPYPGFYRSAALYVELDGALIFPANDGVHGFELWRTDGTEAGTWMLKDIRPGPLGAFDAEDYYHEPILDWQPVVAGGRVYFVANDGVHGWELWKTDGTEAGTSLVDDIVPGPGGPFGGLFQVTDFDGVGAGGNFFFSADDGIHGMELWRTDGTPAGTVLLKDISPGPGSSFPGSLFSSGDTVLFVATDPGHGRELWRSDGTGEGTILLADIAPGPDDSHLSGFTEVNGAALFFAYPYTKLYRTDGTPGGTMAVREFDSVQSLFGEWNGSLLFLADDGTHGVELWKSDGTDTGTVLVKDITPGPAGSTFYGLLGEAEGKLFFWVDDGIHGAELWRSDGTDAGTALVKDITPGPAGSTFYGLLVEAAGKLFLWVDDGIHGAELWRSDGTDAGTALVRDITPGPSGSTLMGGAGVDGTLLFVLEDDSHVQWLWKSDGTLGGTMAVRQFDSVQLFGEWNGSLLFLADDGTHGVELWKSDGTNAGTALVKDINPIMLTDSSNTRFMGAVPIPGLGKTLFFSADDGVHGTELWASDGTEAGTRLVKDIYPGPYGSYPSPGIAFGGALYFAAGDAEHGTELWRSDGTEQGTRLVADINPGFDGSFTYDNSTFLEVNGSLFFGADDGIHGRALWKSDGTEAGTVLVAAVDLQSSFTIYRPPIAIGGTLYFGAWDAAHGLELWKSDGTAAGTVLVKDIAPGPAASGPRTFAEIHGKLFFTGTDPVHGDEPWVSDGTEAGTFLLKDILPGRSGSRARAVPPQALGGSVYFTAGNATPGEELWKTDGTEAGTVLVKNVRPGVRYTTIDSLTALNGTLFFTVGFAGTQDELWKSDGTEEGTRSIKTGLNVYGLTEEGSLPLVQAVDGGFLFASYDADHGKELWRSDGTEKGTLLAQDIAPGPDASDPQAFIEVGDRVFFVARDGAAGQEPWVAHTAILLGQPARAIQDLAGELAALHLPKGLETSLRAQLDVAGKAFAEHRTTEAMFHLEVFRMYVDVLSPRWIPEKDAGGLIEFASEIIELLEEASSPPPALPAPAPGAAGPPRLLTGR
jgi:ELWxxDGT repeat protein